MTAAYIAKALDGRRYRSGWMARCPAHDDNHPSLSLRDANGKILVHCFAGCSPADVIAALREHCLWPERVKWDLTPAERREYARNRARAEILAKRALLWRAAILQELERAKASAFLRDLSHPDHHTERALADAARRLYLAEQLSGVNLAEAYRTALKNNHARVRKLISKSQQNVRHAERFTNLALAALARRVGDER